LDDKLFQSTEYVSKHTDVELRYKDAMRVKDELQTVEIRLANLTVACATHTQKDETLNREMIRLTGLLARYDTNKAAIENNRSLQLRINELEQKKTSLDKVVKQFQTDLRNHDRELSVVRAKKDDMLKTIKEAESLETTYEAYETYLDVIGRDGLPYELISQVIPTLQTEVNNTLAQIVDFSISLEVDGKNINGRILYEDDRTWPLELASGMEKFISGLAIRVALMTVSNLPKSNFLVIDEGLGVLDSDNLASMSVLFNILKSQFDFMILISHLDTVRDVADTLIDIRREDGFSYILVE
jgi:DNA repair protein SbcC/Rad50